MYRIPLFDLNYDEKEEQAALATIHSGWISSGPKCAEFEEKFAGALGAKHACAVANCTAALHLALAAIGIGPGDEVIVPSLTFVATVNAVRYTGAEPVFADITGREDLTISPVEIEKLISPRTKAITVMHFAGFPCDMDSILELAEKHDLRVVEDACHGPLSEYHGRKLGTLGDIGCFSFFSNKNMSTGEGGMLVTDDDELAEKIKLMRSHGMTSMSYERASGHSTTYDVVTLGYNYRMDDIHAAIGLAQLEKLRPDLEKRSQVRAQYLRELADCDGIIVPFADRTEFSSNYIMPVLLSDGDAEKRDRVRDLLQEAGIQTSIHYPAAHRFSIYKGAKSGELTHTNYATDCEFTLPMYARLTPEQVSYICGEVRKAVGEIK